jgi:hypothetical protein
MNYTRRCSVEAVVAGHLDHQLKSQAPRATSRAKAEVRNTTVTNSSSLFTSPPCRTRQAAQRRGSPSDFSFDWMTMLWTSPTESRLTSRLLRP